MPKVVLVVSRTFSFAMGAQKLGQPVPDSNLVLESNRAVSQHMQRKTPFSWLFGFSFVYGCSVPDSRVTSNESGESCFRHSSSVFSIRATVTVPSRLPALVNCTIFTIFGSPAAAASTWMGADLWKNDQTSPTTAMLAPIKNARRPLGLLI